MPRTLYVVATPIGNLKDITLRALEILGSVNFILCEDTRQTLKLLSHHGLSKTLIRYDENVHARALPEILNRLQKGQDGAIVTDAGTPGISDPGVILVDHLRNEGFMVVPIPGPSAPIAALSASGLGQGGFLFLGFLPRRNSRARRALQEGLGLGKTLVVFESPFRLESLLDLIQSLDDKAKVVVARELTKIHEEFLRGSALEIKEKLKEKPPKGEVVVLIEAQEEPGSRVENN
jgi:16S rRNA (cytidine1402-2'-O)-methyltransferase